MPRRDRHPRRPLVWIADDSPVETSYTERALGPAYDYELFSDGTQVVERLVAGGAQPDVLLLDWVMPVMAGDQVCRFLRSHPPTAELPIIIVTASRVETGDIVEGLAIGANDYIARPFAPEELRARVDTAIRAKRHRERAARERARLAMFAGLGRAVVAAGPSADRVVEALACALVGGVCDGCSIIVLPSAGKAMTIARHRAREHEALLAAFSATDPCTYTFATADEARATLPPAYHPAIDRLGMSALVVAAIPVRDGFAGVVTAMRDGGSEPFDDDDVVTIETCIEYAAIAIENAQRLDAERATRAQLQTILEQLPSGVVAADASGRITHVNATALELIPELAGARTTVEVAERVALRTMDGAEIGPAERPLARALAGATVRAVELELAAGGAPPLAIRASAVPLRGAAGEVVAAVVVFDDITAERAAVAERDRAAEFQRYVLGIVGHDLRSPLQTIAMGCEAIRTRVADAWIGQLVDRIDATTSRIKGIIEPLLDVTRAQLGGGIPVDLADTDLAAVVDAVVAEVSLAYPQVDFQLQLERVHGRWDADRLAQVVANLIGNAIQHGARGTPVSVETGRDGETAWLVVRNVTGTPLAPDQIGSMFTPFGRGPSSDRRTRGLGLGLYITSEILRAHHGEIRVESDPELTSFIVRLPIDQPRHDPAPPLPAAHEPVR